MKKNENIWLKMIFIIFIIPILIFAELPKNKYIIENQKIYYQSDFQKLPVVKVINRGKFDEDLLFYPDFATFKILNNNYAIDKDSVFFNGFNIKEADVKTFEILEIPLAKDRNFVYYYGVIAKYSGKNIDGKTLSVVKSSDGNIKFLKDKNGIYKDLEAILGRWEKINEKETSDLEDLGNGYSRDRNNIYVFERKSEENIDIKTFKVLKNGYSRDKNNIYYYGRKVEGIDINDYEILGSEADTGYIKDKNNIFYNERKIENADIPTFEILEYNHSKDKNAVYYYGEKIEGADPKTFKHFPPYYWIDKNDVYSGGKKLNVNPKTFSIFEKNNNYGKDDRNIYYISSVAEEEGKILKDADVKTFVILNNLYSKDSKNVYLDYNQYVEKLEGTDAKTFILLNEKYAKDKNAVYYNGQKIENANPKSFEIISDEIGKDKNRVYKQDKILGDIEFSFFDTEDIYQDKLKNPEKYKVEVDAKTFRKLKASKEINGYYALDKNRGYYIESANSPGYLEGTAKVIYLNELNVANVNLLNPFYIKDDKKVYCLGFEVEYADAKTFKVKNNYSSEAEDKNNKYEYCKITRK